MREANYEGLDLEPYLVGSAVGYGLDHSCPGKWYEERKKFLETIYKNGGAITYSFRVNTRGTAADDQVK